MPRNLYNADHEAFRQTAREFVERSLKPRAEQFIEARVIDREAWLEAGKQGLLGLEGPEVYGGSGGWRLQVQRGPGRGTIQVQRRGVLVLRHPRRLRGPVSGGPGYAGTEAALASRLLLGRPHHRHRDDGAQRWLRSRGTQEHGCSRW